MRKLSGDRSLDLLQEQQTGLFESTGVFTIAADKALAKLAHSQLPDPSYWVLKVAQFAAAIGVQEVTVSVDRRITRVAMELPYPLSIAQLRSGLDSVAPLEDRALDHLVTGLRAVGGTPDRPRQFPETCFALGADPPRRIWPSASRARLVAAARLA